jgi:pyruvate dehydrogenase E2 component (dihydrolipoamide acetyltransferase)
MPKWGIEMTEGTVAEWMVKEGRLPSSAGQTLCLIETAKITNEVEAEYDAVLQAPAGPAGEDAHAGRRAAWRCSPMPAPDAEIDAFIAGFKPSRNIQRCRQIREASRASGRSPPLRPLGSSAPRAPKKIVTNRPISPEALKLAEPKASIIDAIAGSGRGGRITYQDVYQAPAPSAPPR